MFQKEKWILLLSAIAILLSTSCTIITGDDDDDDNTAAAAALLLASSDNATTLSGTISADQTVSGTVKLDGIVYVDGATLTVSAGTTVYGPNGSVLVIKQGGKLMAEGSSTSPIRFTSANAEGSRAPGDWGGVMIIGEGITNKGTSTVEGGLDITYGGDNNSGASSGTLKYVTIEFAGYEVADGDELNGLSSYTVTDQTTYEYVQVHRGQDDGFEWWGGAVNGSYLLATGNQDDDFDIDEGYQGTLKYLIAHKYTNLTDCPTSFSADPHGMEMDGSSGGAAVTKGSVSNPTVEYFTLVGSGQSGGYGQRYREGIQGNFSKGLIYGFADGNIRCDSNTAGAGDTAPTIASTVNTESAKSGSNKITCTTTNMSQTATLSATPITSEGTVTTDCTVATEPDYTTPSSAGSDTGGAPTSNWPSGWATFRYN